MIKTGKTAEKDNTNKYVIEPEIKITSQCDGEKWRNKMKHNYTYQSFFKIHTNSLQCTWIITVCHQFIECTSTRQEWKIFQHFDAQYWSISKQPSIKYPSKQNGTDLLKIVQKCLKIIVSYDMKWTKKWEITM